MLDQRPQNLDRWSAVLIALQVLAQLANPILIDMRHVRMQQGRWFIGIRQQLGQFDLACFQLLGLVLQLLRWEASKDGVDHLVQLAISPFKLLLPSNQIRAALDPKTVHLAREFRAKLLEELRHH
ncbi:hypothetical protein [Roseibium sp.]|uniref:hypothetical protein n=1 Tax=Roseibium sp. TaxID=1936156 RepID=UPI003299EBEC